MAKESGMGDNFYLDGYNLSGDIGSLSRIGGGPQVIDVTAIDKSAFERVGGLRDGTIEFSAYFNPSTDRAHDRLSNLPTTDVQIMYFHGQVQGNDAAAMVAKQVSYDGTRNADGSFTFAVQAVSNSYGLEWGKQITAGIRTDVTGTTPATGLDFGAATSFGWQAYLQVFAFAGTSVTVTLEDSANNSSFAGFTGSAFTAATAIGTQRLASATPTATVRRYVRAVTSGTFTVANFALIFVKNESLVAF